MTCQNLFNKGFPTNRIPVKLPSSGREFVLRETTVTELKSICKIVIDNIDKKQMDVIYDAVTDYLQSMILTEGVDVHEFTEFDRLYCLMIFFQMSFYKEPGSFKCPHCGVEIVYRYDMTKYIYAMEKAYVEEQVVDIPHKSRIYRIVIGWPKLDTMGMLMHYFYGSLGEVTQEIEQTQFGINFVMSFIHSVRVVDPMKGETDSDPFVDLWELDDWESRMACLNELPSLVVFDQDNGAFSKITGYFINRLENCFKAEICPQCRKETYFGLSQSSYFHGLFYGSLRGMYGFILQIECLLLFKYDSLIFDQEQYMTYNDLSSLMKQLGTTVEKDNKERQNANKDNFTKGLWYIREILNTMIFPYDKKNK